MSSPASVPEIKYEAGEWVIPLIKAGSWLRARTVAGAIKEEGKAEEAARLLKQPHVIDYFIEYVDREGAEKAPDAVIAKLKESLQTTATAKSAAEEADVNTVQRDRRCADHALRGPDAYTCTFGMLAGGVAIADGKRPTLVFGRRSGKATTRVGQSVQRPAPHSLRATIGSTWSRCTPVTSIVSRSAAMRTPTTSTSFFTMPMAQS